MADCAATRAAVGLPARDLGDAFPPEVGLHLATCDDCRGWVAALRRLDGALGALGQALPSLPAPPFERVQRRAQRAARGYRRRRALRRLLPLSLAVTGAVAATFIVTALARRPAERVAHSGQVLDASRASAQAVLIGGARLTVASGRAVVTLSERGRAHVHLDTGSAFLSVPHLDPGATFLVTTDEAEIRVRGTRFDVARGPQGTRVSVSEGTVEVRSRAGDGRAWLVKRGESALLEGTAARRAAARAAALAAIEQRDDSATGERIAAWLATSPPDQEAAEAHALLAWKLSRDGDHAGALRSYRRALALLPAGAAPLWADNAGAQLALLSERDDPLADGTAWRDYLRRFPAGVHAALARDRLARAAAPEATR